MVIDFRTRPPYKSFITEGNFFPRPMEDAYAKKEEVPGIYMGSEGIESARVGNFELYMEELKSSGIDMQVVQGRKVRPGMACVSNEDVCQLQQEFPDCFIAFPAVDPADVPAAVREINYYVNKYQIKGIAMEPGWAMPPKYVDDKELNPIYEKCEEYGLICAFTLSVLAGEDLSFCNPINLQKVALRFPKVTFTVSHGCWPYVEEFLGVALQCINIYFYPDFFCNIPNMPMSNEFIQAANSYMRYRMLFATSYPVRPLKQSLDYFMTLGFEPEILELLLHKNAERILKL